MESYIRAEGVVDATRVHFDEKMPVSFLRVVDPLVPQKFTMPFEKMVNFPPRADLFSRESVDLDLSLFLFLFRQSKTLAICHGPLLSFLASKSNVLCYIVRRILQIRLLVPRGGNRTSLSANWASWRIAP